MLLTSDEVIQLKDIQLNIQVLVDLVNKKKVPYTESLHQYLYNSTTDAINTFQSIQKRLNDEHTTLSN